MLSVICYLVDILVTGRTESEHLQNSEEVFRSMESKSKVKNVCFYRTQYLGHCIDATGIYTSQDKLNAILKAPQPQNVQQLRAFQGLLNYYGKFLANLSSVLHPLNKLLHQDVNQVDMDFSLF